MVIRSCLHCGRSFEVPYRSSRRVNCSEECRIARLRQPGRKRRSDTGTRKVKWVSATCANCGKAFEIPPWEVKSASRATGAVYCTRECGEKAQQRHAQGIEVEGRRVPKARSLRGRGRYVGNRGYVMVYVPPHKRPVGHERTTYHPEHRAVMADVLGRWPEKHESVHHINGDRLDNRPENLQLRSGSHGRGKIARCRRCGSSDIEFVELP